MKLLALSGFIPEQICDIVRFTRYPGGGGISHYCGYASDFISQVLHDGSVDGAVFPKSCDSSRVINSYCAGSGKFLYQLHIPVGRDPLAVQYLAAGIRAYKAAVEKHYRIKADDIEERIERVNIRNQKLRQLYGCIGEISYSAYLEALHHMLSVPLHEQMVPDGMGKKDAGGKRVYLVGSTLSEHGIARAVEDAGMNIVGDNLTESKRLFSAPPVEAEKGRIYENIAQSILKNRVSPTQNNFADILAEDMREIRQKDVQGVIYISQKYCEAYDYLFPAYKGMLDGYGVPVLRLPAAGSANGSEMGLAIEAFADIL